MMHYDAHQMLCDVYLPKSSAFASSVLRIPSQLSWEPSRCFVANVGQAFVFFLVSSGFRLEILPWMLFSVQVS